MVKLHTYHYSHEIEDGPSGPARSYWMIRRGSKTVINNLCLNKLRDWALLEAQRICAALDEAFEAGKAQKAAEIQDILGIRR